MRKSWAASAAIMVSLVLGGAAVAGSPAAGQSASTTTPAVTLALDCSAFEALPAQVQGIRLAVGGDLLVMLCSNPSTGFAWSDPVISDSSILSTTGSSAEPARSPRPGAAGTQAFSFHAEQAGSTSVRLAYSRAWEGGEEGVWSVDLDVAVVPAAAAPVAVNVSCDAFEATPFQGAGTILAVGDNLLVTLCSNASTGYVWGDPQISDASVVALTSTRSEAPASPLPGAAGSQSWVFEALTAGVARVHMSYGQPWEGGAQDAWTFDLDVTVR
jgi:predicted secreted protein